MESKSPRETIRVYCLYCTGGHRKDVESCDGDDPAFRQCVFHPYRTGKNRPSVKIMRKFCLQCMGGSLIMVRECETTDCLIYSFRFGKCPSRKGKGQSADRMAVVREKKRPLSLKNLIYVERSPVGYW